MLPRIPKVRDFHAFAKAGRALAELHVGYESAAPHALEEIVTGKLSTAERYRVQQMRFAGSGKQKDRTKIVDNAHLTLAGIPEEAYRYQLGSRSAVEWVMDRYRVTTDKGQRHRQRSQRLGRRTGRAALHRRARQAGRHGELGDDANRRRSADSRHPGQVEMS